MGLDADTIRFLLQAKKQGAKCDRMITLGRQHFFVSSSEIRNVLLEAGIPLESHKNLLSQPYPSYADEFWKVLGCSEVVTLDASDFEGADVVHDLNKDMPQEWLGTYDAVCDVGTLEHVFLFPNALRNCLELLKVGGTFFTFTTANNYFGHGFYQFSPELFFRVLNEDNGFRLKRCFAVEYGPVTRWFDISDPEKIRSRVTLINRYPVLLFVEAERVKKVSVLSKIPQQSDYVEMWQASKSGGDGVALASRVKDLLLDAMPGLARTMDRLRMNFLDGGYRWRNRAAFRRASKSLR